MPPIQAITFDVGSTLIDPWPSVGHVYAEVAAQHGYPGLCPDLLNQRFHEAWAYYPHPLHAAEDWAEVVDRTFAPFISRRKPLGSVFDFLNKGEEIPGEMPDLNKKEFSYKRLEAKATYGGGLLTIDEGFLNSEMLHAIGQGTIQIEDGSLDLDVMVAPLKTVSRITRNVPLIGTITGGSLVSVPEKVRGTFTDPKVTYLAPSVAVSNLAEMMKRSIGLPFRIFSPLFPREQEP